MTLYTALVLAMLGLYPNILYRDCLRDRAPQIARALEEAERVHGVPPGLMLAVALRESHCGCATGCGGNWGAPISPRQRHTPGTPMHAARALARSWEVCGSWEGAVSRFRFGACRPPADRPGYHPTTILDLARRLEARARTIMGAEGVESEPGC